MLDLVRPGVVPGYAHGVPLPVISSGPVPRFATVFETRRRISLPPFAT